MPKKQEPDEPVVLTDPRAIRALAHPARLTVLTELEPGTELTATELAARAEVTPSAMSYHLRALERAGIVRRAQARGDGRERPWRMVGRGIQVSSTSSASAAAEDAVIGAVFERTRATFREWLHLQGDESDEWRDVPSIRRSGLWLTLDEASGLAERLGEVLQPYLDRDHAGERPADAREIEALTVVVPRVK